METEACSLQEDFYFPGICRSIQLLRQALPGDRVYLDRVLRSLEAFGAGGTGENFAFTLALYRGRDLQRLDFALRGDSLTVSEGGFVYDAAQFGDIYGDWSFTLWQDGSTSGACRLDMRRLRELLRAGAVLVPDSAETGETD